jgi:hypothetical protein
MVVLSCRQPRLTLYDGMRDFRLVYRRIDGNVD